MTDSKEARERLRGVARLNAKTVADAEAAHCRRLGIASLDVDLHDLVKQLAARKFAERMARLDDLRAHPEYAAVGTPAPMGELAELRHLLYDADPDATTPAFRYPTTEEAS